MKTILGFILGAFIIAIPTFGATVLKVYQGGTGASTFATGECLVGNGTGPITTQACGATGSIGTVGEIGDVNTTTLSYGSHLVWDTTEWKSTSTWPYFKTEWDKLHNATTTYPGFQSQFDTALNATTTLDLTTFIATNINFTSATGVDSFYTGGYASTTGGLFTQGNGHIGGTFSVDGVVSGNGMTNFWNTQFNGTSTWKAFDSNWNRNYNATTTLNGFTINGDWTGTFDGQDGTYYATSTGLYTKLATTEFQGYWDTAFNGTSTWTAFTSNWNTLHNATTTYPGFSSQVNASSTMAWGKCANNEILKSNGTNWVCAADNDTGAGTGSNWTYVTDVGGDYITPSTTIGFISKASSTIYSLTVNDLRATTSLDYWLNASTTRPTTSQVWDISANTNLTAGDALTLTDDDIDFDGGASPGGSLGGTWASPTIDDLFLLNTTDSSTGGYTFGNVTSTGSLTVGSLLNCDTIDTDGNGLLKCGTDNASAGAAYAEFTQVGSNQQNVSTTPFLFANGLQASSTVLFDSATITDSLFTGGYASTTGGVFSQGNAHFGGTMTADGNYLYPTFSYATSTTWTGTTTIPLGSPYANETWSSVKCFTDAGTVNVEFSDGTNKMNLIVASTSGDFVVSQTLSTNNTFTAGEKRYVNLGGPATAPTKISCTVRKQ